MPSNADIIKAIAEAAEAAGVDVPETEGLKNDELAEVLSGLKKTDKKQDKADTLVVAAAAAAERTEEEAKVKKPPFEIAKGKSLTSKRGILGPGKEVKAEDLAGGKDAIAAFVKSGHIVKN